MVCLWVLYIIIAVSFLSLFLLPGFKGLNTFLLSHPSSQCLYFIIGLKEIQIDDHALKPLRPYAEINLPFPLSYFLGDLLQPWVEKLIKTVTACNRGW